MAQSHDVRDRPVAVELLREHLVLWRGPRGRVIATLDKCSHRPSVLSPGIVDDGCLVCPHHGRSFGEDGRCVDIPAGKVIEESDHLTAFGCEERHGLVWVCLGDPRTEIPTVAVGDDPAFERVNAAPETWTVPAARVIEALLEQEVADARTAAFDVPFTYHRSESSGDGGSATHLLVTCSPVGADVTRVFAVVWSNGATAVSADRLEAEVAAITALRPGVEAVRGLFEIDETALGGADDGRSTYRHALLEAVTAPV